MSIARASLVKQFVVLGVIAAFVCGSAQAAPLLTVTALLQAGWEIAGYTGAGDNRASLLLFKKAGEAYLVQCATFHDVTRTPRVSTNCYELR